jgi:hypothetical protein
MAKTKVDGVVQAVHYNPDGQVDWARVYVRRGPTFSDRMILNRQALIANIQSGKHYFIGERVPQMASTFELASPLQIAEKNGKQILLAGAHDADRDLLVGVPVI